VSDPWCDTSTLLKLYIAYVNPHLQYCSFVWDPPLQRINSLGVEECTDHHPGSRGMADIMSVTMPLLSIEDLVAISTRVGPAEDDPLLHKRGLKPVQAVCKGESGAQN